MLLFHLLLGEFLHSAVRVAAHTTARLRSPVCFNTRYSVTHPVKWGHSEESAFVLDRLCYSIRHSHTRCTRHRSFSYLLVLEIFLNSFCKTDAKKKRESERLEWTPPLNEFHFLSHFSYKETNFIRFPRLFKSQRITAEHLTRFPWQRGKRPWPNFKSGRSDMGWFRASLTTKQTQSRPPLNFSLFPAVHISAFI